MKEYILLAVAEIIWIVIIFAIAFGVIGCSMTVIEDKGWHLSVGKQRVTDFEMVDKNGAYLAFGKLIIDVNMIDLKS